jgi:hypothetical protein
MHAVHRQRAQQGGLRVIGGSISLGFEMMVLESVRERERMLVSSWIHEFFDHRVAFSKKKKRTHVNRVWYHTPRLGAIARGTNLGRYFPLPSYAMAHVMIPASMHTFHPLTSLLKFPCHSPTHHWQTAQAAVNHRPAGVDQ